MIDSDIQQVLDEMHKEIELEVKAAEELKKQNFRKVCADNNLVDMEKKILSNADSFANLAEGCSGEFKKTFENESRYLKSLLTKEVFRSEDIDRLIKINKEINY